MNKYCNWQPSSILLGQSHADSNEIIVLFRVKKKNSNFNSECEHYCNFKWAKNKYCTITTDYNSRHRASYWTRFTHLQSFFSCGALSSWMTLAKESMSLVNCRSTLKIKGSLWRYFLLRVHALNLQKCNANLFVHLVKRCFKYLRVLFSCKYKLLEVK